MNRNVKEITVFVVLSFYLACNAAKSNFYLYTDDVQEPVMLFDDPDSFSKISYNYEQAKKDFCNSDPFKSCKTFDIGLQSNTHISMMHFDHNSDTLLVIGGGFDIAKERWKYVLQLFEHYDIVIFDYRWAAQGFFRMPSTLLHPFKKIFLDEREEVVNVVNVARELKPYKRVIGLAECYSCFIFAQAQAEQEEQGLNLFDKLIFDSALVSLQAVNDSSIHDPELCCRNRDENPASCPIGLRYPWICKPLLAFSHLFFPDLSMSIFIKKINAAPMLFIHGHDDALISLDVLINEVWGCSQAPMTLISTPYPHARSRTDWGVYKFICEKFIQTDSQKDFFQCIQTSA